MRVAVTGSSGLIGSALVKALSDDGVEVVRVVRRPRDDGPTARWDPETGAIEAAALEGLDAVVHLAGEGIGDRRWTEQHKRRVLESRTGGTSLLARTLARLSRPPKVLLSGSAIDFYGKQGDTELTEASPKGEGFLADVCAAWEAAAAPAAAAGIRVVSLRTGIVQSPDGGALGRLLLLFRLGLGGRFGDGHQYWSWISVDDEVGAIRFLIDADVTGPVNLTAPEPVTNREYTRTLARVLRRPAFLPVPSFGPKLLLGSEGARAMVLEGQRVLPAVLQASGYEFRHPNLELALRSVLGR